MHTEVAESESTTNVRKWARLENTRPEFGFPPLKRGAQQLPVSNRLTSRLTQWLKCNGTQGNAVPPPPIYGLNRSPNSDCYNARERHTTIVRGSNLNVAFPHLKFCTLTTGLAREYLQNEKRDMQTERSFFNCDVPATFRRHLLNFVAQKTGTMMHGSQRRHRIATDPSCYTSSLSIVCLVWLIMS